MKISITLILLLILSSSAWGYSKKIIFSSFSDKQSAEKSLDKFLSTPQKSQKLMALAKNNEFQVHIRESGKYYIMVAEPIRDKTLLSKTIKIVKKSYKQAYANNYTPPKVPVEVPKVEAPKVAVEKTQEVNVSKAVVTPVVEKEKLKEKLIEEVEKVEKVEVEIPLEPVVEIKTTDVNIITKESTAATQENNVSVKKEFKTLEKEEEIDVTLVIKWLLLFVVLGVLLFYFMKFKRVYDEY